VQVFDRQTWSQSFCDSGVCGRCVAVPVTGLGDYVEMVPTKVVVFTCLQIYIYQPQGRFLETASCLPSPSLGVVSCGGGFCVASVVLSSSGPGRGNFHIKNWN